MTSLPSEIGRLQNLQWFDCSNNGLTFLPPEIGRLQKLQIFSCSNNRLTFLPSEIGRLQNLEAFYCSNNPLSSLPTSLPFFIKKYKFELFNRNELIISLILLKFVFQDICFPLKIMNLILKKNKKLK